MKLGHRKLPTGVQTECSWSAGRLLLRGWRISMEMEAHWVAHPPQAAEQLKSNAHKNILFAVPAVSLAFSIDKT